MDDWIARWLGVWFVSEDLPNHESIEGLIAEESERLREKAMDEFDSWLAERGLEQVMGVIVKKGEVG